MSHGAQITNIADVRSFIFAGNALFTLVSKRSGARKTFKVEQAEQRAGDTREPGFFVKLLNGPQNTTDYRYLGFAFRSPRGYGFKLNKNGWATEAGAAFSWLLSQLSGSQEWFAEQCEVWHEGRCGKCGRTLTTPESIERGIGPVCAEGGRE